MRLKGSGGAVTQGRKDGKECAQVPPATSCIQAFHDTSELFSAFTRLGTDLRKTPRNGHSLYLHIKDENQKLSEVEGAAWGHTDNRWSWGSHALASWPISTTTPQALWIERLILRVPVRSPTYALKELKQPEANRFPGGGNLSRTEHHWYDQATFPSAVSFFH